MLRFRSLWPLGTIKRAYVLPVHPLPALALAVLAAIVFFATFLGYGSTLMSILVFYLLASVWFVVRRYKYVDRDAEFTAPLPRPRGY
jgi:ethanolamine permease